MKKSLGTPGDNNFIIVSWSEYDCGSCLLLPFSLSIIRVSPRDLRADSIMREQSACGAVIYQTQRAGWEPIPFLCHLMLSLRTAILVDKCPYPWVIRDPPWEKSLTFYYASAVQTTPRVAVTTDIHHISLDTNAEKINQASSMTIHLFLYLCSLLWSSVKQDWLNNNSLWQHFPTIPSLSCSLASEDTDTNMFESSRGKMWCRYKFITKDMGHSICLWEQSEEERHIVFYAFVGDFSDSQIVAVPHKNIYLYFADEAYFWSQIHWGRRNPPDSHIKPVNVSCCLPPHPSPRPHRDPLSSPSGILLFSWWKRLLGSCTNELALLLNDVCKLWPSLLPMNGAETQNPHRQLGARSHCEQLAVELKWIVEAGWSLGIPSTAHWRCLVVGRHSSEVFPLEWMHSQQQYIRLLTIITILTLFRNGLVKQVMKQQAIWKKNKHLCYSECT